MTGRHRLTRRPFLATAAAGAGGVLMPGAGGAAGKPGPDANQLSAAPPEFVKLITQLASSDVVVMVMVSCEYDQDTVNIKTTAISSCFIEPIFELLKSNVKNSLFMCVFLSSQFFT